MRAKVINQTWDGPGGRVGDVLSDSLHSKRPRYQSFFAVSAWVRETGILSLEAAIKAFRDRGGVFQAVVGLDLAGTSLEGLEALNRIADEAYVFHNPLPAATFHPKGYVFVGSTAGRAIIGSTNLTRGGLYTNYEASAVFDLKVGETQDDRVLAESIQVFNAAKRAGRRVDTALIAELVRNRMLLDETVLEKRVAARSRARTFESLAVPAPPALSSLRALKKKPKSSTTALEIPTLDTFAMTLGTFDVSVAGGRSPDMLIPKAARDALPSFWRWPKGFGGSSPTGPERHVTLRLTVPPDPQSWLARESTHTRRSPSFGSTRELSGARHVSATFSNLNGSPPAVRGTTT